MPRPAGAAARSSGRCLALHLFVLDTDGWLPRRVPTMPETTFTLRLDTDLKANFSQAAQAHDRKPSQLLRDFMRQFIEQPASLPAYDDWLIRRVQAAIHDPRPAVPAAAAEARFKRIKATAKRKHGNPRRR